MPQYFLEVSMAYATPDDLITRMGGSLSTEDRTRVTAMAEDFSAFMDDTMSDHDVDPESVSQNVKKQICVDLLVSWWSLQGVPAGAASMSQTVGDVSESVSYGAAASAQTRSPFWLSASQKARLGIKQRISSMIMVPDVPSVKGDYYG